MDEILRRMVAAINANAFLPPDTGDEIMAKPVKLKQGKEFNFKSVDGGQASKYPWKEWFNGDLLLLEKSTMEPTGQKNDKGKDILRATHKRDFDVEVDAMVPKIKTAARKKYKVVQVSKLDADGKKLVDSVIIKARDMTAEERTAEDLKRAEEKAAREADENEEGEEATMATAGHAVSQTGAA